ncbi:MAG: addB, partial [Belnapia sp.]|nr:addB [Belnapia sp.]
QISVTEVETLLADPYAFYARRVLRLFPLDPLDAEVGAADYGNLVHAAMAGFIRWLAAGPWPGEVAAQAIFDEAAALALAEAGARPGLLAFWQPRLARIGGFVVEREAEARAGNAIARSLVELTGEIPLRQPDGRVVTLTARADRIDVLANGRLAILDYKTGTMPGPKAVKEGHKPQLLLEAAMAAKGAFGGLPAGDAAALVYWKLTGGPKPGEVQPISADRDEIAGLAEEAIDRVNALAARFLLGAAPFLAWPHPGREPAGDEYQHLSRRAEWAGAEDSVDG